MARVGAARTSKSLFTAVHHRITRIPLHLMPGEAQLIHIAEREKDVFVAVLALTSFGSTELTARDSEFMHCPVTALNSKELPRR